MKMLALRRRRSKSRGRSKDRARLKKSNIRELPGVPTIITICNDNSEDEERIQPQKSKRVRNKNRRQSRERTKEEKDSEEFLSEEFLTDDELLREYRMDEKIGGSERRRDGAKPLGLSSEIDDSSLLSSPSDSQHTRSRSKSSTTKNRSNSRKLARSLSDSDRSLEVDHALEELQNEKTRNLLREELMKECMGAIERRQKQARQLISLDEQKLRKDFDNLLKQSIKQSVTRNSIAKMKCNSLKSNPPPPTPDNQGFEKKKRRTSNSDNPTKNSKAINLSDHSSSEAISPRKLKLDKPEKKVIGRKQSLKKKKTSTNSNRSTPQKSTISSSGSSTKLSIGEQRDEKKGETKKNSTTTKKLSHPKSQKKLSTTAITELTDDTSHHFTSDTKYSQNFLQDLETETEEKSPNKSAWRKRVSSIISAGRSRSKSNERPKNQSRSKSNDRSKRKDRSKSRTRQPRKSRPWGSRPSGKRTGTKTETQSKKPSSDNRSVEDYNDLNWHNAINKHDWDCLRTMLKSYDHARYRQRSNDIGKSRNSQDVQEISPLLNVDSNGRTPLHLACKEQMPSRLLHRLLFVERNAASVQDTDGNYPLHLAVIYDLDQHILDRVIHASPDSLDAPDNLNHTPIQYAILKADRCRGNKEVKWGPPDTEDEAERQNILIDAYQPVLLILESMIKRHKVLSKVHGSKTTIEAVKLFAPPVVVDLMVTLSENILQKNQKISERLIGAVFEQNHPLNVIHRVLDVTSKAIPSTDLLEMLRNRLTFHFTQGCDSTTITDSNGEKVTTSLAKQFEKTCRRGGKKAAKTTSASKDWWEKLRYLIARSCNRTSNWKNDTVLHMALCNPKSKPSLIEYLCRLNPAARYKLDEFTGALPIHLAYMHWHPEEYGIGDMRSQEKVLNLLLAGDFDLVRKCCCHGRIALHYAVLSGKPMSCVQNLLNLAQEITVIRDPVTNLLPFQLAATPKNYEDEKSSQQLDVIYNLLRTNPF